MGPTRPLWPKRNTDREAAATSPPRGCGAGALTVVTTLGHFATLRATDLSAPYRPKVPTVVNVVTL